VLLIWPWGPAFWTVRSAKRGLKRIDQRFDGFVERFTKTYGFAPLWVDLDTSDRRSRSLDVLYVVLERSSERGLFDPIPSHEEDRARRRVVRAMFAGECETVHFPMGPFGLRQALPDVAHLTLQFDDFERLAVQKAHESIHGRRLHAFEQQLQLGDLFWCTASGIEPPVVFVHTDEQSAKVRASGLASAWADLWYELVKPYDEFDYITRDDIAIRVDSKQNLDDNYESNWRYYST
jgi:hypothetical protein